MRNSSKYNPDKAEPLMREGRKATGLFRVRMDELQEVLVFLAYKTNKKKRRETMKPLFVWKPLGER